MAHRCISNFPIDKVVSGTRLKWLHCSCLSQRHTRGKPVLSVFNLKRNCHHGYTTTDGVNNNICKYHQRELFRNKYYSIYYRTNSLQCTVLPACSYPVLFSPSYNPSINLHSIRSFHLSTLYHKEKSKVEKSVNVLKSSTEENGVKDTTSVVDDAQPQATVESTEKTTVVLPKASLWQKVKDTVSHYYNGFKLLFIDIKVCCRLLWKLWNGHTLSRREYRQMVRTAADIFRLIPFSIFIIVPFMEFLLPVAIKFFPNMLPSTFKEEKKEIDVWNQLKAETGLQTYAQVAKLLLERWSPSLFMLLKIATMMSHRQNQDKLKKQLKVKLEIAKFLQDAAEEMPILLSKKNKKKIAEEFSEFIRKARSEGVPVSTEEIIKFSKLFEDDITLDNLDTSTLRALCQVLNIPLMNVTGSFDTMLRFQLEMKLRELLADDKMIEKEKVDSLTIWELQAACRARGMRALGVPENRLKFQLQQWLDLRLNHKIPTSLLLLSRTLYIPEEISTTERLKTIISTLPEKTTTQARILAQEVEGEEVDNIDKLELIKLEEEKIKKETLEKQAEEAETERKEKEKQELIQEAVAAESAMTSKDDLPDTAIDIEIPPSEELKTPAEEEEERITSKDLEEIESALEEIAEEKHLDIDKEELEDLKEDVTDYKENLEDLKSVIIKQGGYEQDLVESKAAKRLTKRVDRLVNQIHGIVDELHLEKEQIQEEIEVGEVKMKRSRELLEDEEKRQEMIDALSKKKGNVISINELVLALKRLQKVPDDDKLQKIVQVLDEDQDGNIDITHVLKVIELLGKENVKLSHSQVSNVINLLKQEAQLEEEQRLKDKQKKNENKNATESEEEQQQTQQQ